MANPIKNLSVYVINLDKSKERLQRVQESFESRNMPFERFSAVAGGQLSLDYIESIHKNQKWTAPLIPNEIACYKSHIGVLKHFLAHSDNEYAFICEDDIGLALHARKKLVALIENWPEDCHMIKPYVSARPSGELVEVIMPAKGNFHIRLYKPFKVASTALCHVVNRQGAQKMIDNLKFSRPIDVDLQCVWEHNISILQTNDIGNIIAPLGGISDIQRPKKKPLLVHIRHLYYKIWHYLKNINHHKQYWGWMTILKYILAYQFDKTIFKTKRRYNLFKVKRKQAKDLGK